MEDEENINCYLREFITCFEAILRENEGFFKKATLESGNQYDYFVKINKNELLKTIKQGENINELFAECNKKVNRYNIVFILELLDLIRSLDTGEYLNESKKDEMVSQV